MKVTPKNKRFGTYRPGEVFELPDRLARVLVATGKLERVAPEPAEVEISERTGKPKRQYRRRDMEAE